MDAWQILKSPELDKTLSPEYSYKYRRFKSQTLYFIYTYIYEAANAKQDSPAHKCLYSYVSNNIHKTSVT